MKNYFFLSAVALFVAVPAFSQTEILQERFGSTEWTGDPADYPEYTSDAEFSGDVLHSFPVANSGGYPGASGGGAVLMGNWNQPPNAEFVMQCNTLEYISVRVSFGIRHNSAGWGTCTLTSNYSRIEYSTDSTNWTIMDKAYLLEGSSWPCADLNLWGYVELAEILPSSSTLYIRFTHTNPAEHPYFLDDITLTGFLPDYTPPSTPADIRTENVGFDGFTLIWSSAVDEGGISSYHVMKDGYFLLSTTDTVAEIKYQVPGSSAVYSVKAYDIAENGSEESAGIPVTFTSKPADHKYSWEKSHVTILPGGDLQWKPEAFEFIVGSSVRYIDYENGDDFNDGLTKSSPWKHHPWDGNATGIAAGTSGIHTYVFKRGVVYRGNLTAGESGTPVEPVRLTSDPSWGTGEARFFGSKRITGGWTKADATTAPNIPYPEKVWYVDVALPETKTVCEIDGDQFRQLHLARSPNYRETEGDILETWWKWTGKTAVGGDLWLTDSKNMTQDNAHFYKGATVFSQEDVIVMCTVWKQDVDEWDPVNNRIRVDDTNFGGVGSHYFIENTPFLLDTTGEYYYDAALKRLFVRMVGEKDPNSTIIEAAVKTELIRIDNKHDIEISGITFGITTAHAVRYNESDARSAIRLNGICNNIDIKNNRLLYINGGISMNNTGSTTVNSHGITVSDNDFQHVGDLAIVFSTGNAYLDDVNILRNNIFNTGYRHQGRWYGSIPAIYGQLNYGEVAGNIINVAFGNGIDMFWGKGSGSSTNVPFIRGLIYQNKVSNSLIGVNDYGGIESWQGGPAFCYNNFSHNASGYKHFNNSSIGYAYYFDGSFKHIVFNNIASGISHNRNAASIMQVLGFYNMYVHNTGYNTETLFSAWKGTLAINGYNTYLSNLAEDVNYFFRHEINPSYIPYEAYGYNVSSGSPLLGSLVNRNEVLSLESFKNVLNSYNARYYETGVNATVETVPNADVHDFRIREMSDAVGMGVKFFTPFPLSRVVGEWNFYKHPADLSVIMGDNFYMTEDFNNRETYKDVPKNHLTANNVGEPSFVTGNLEDWTEGALVFDGSTVYCHIDHATSSAVKSNHVDMADNDFILEVFFKSTLGHTGGVIISKHDGTNGFELDIDELGYPRMKLFESGASVVNRTGSVLLNDSLWHHLLVEVNRHAGIDVYVDGILSNGALTGAMPEMTVSLSNSADLLVGKDIDENYFSGTMDFLRISKGTLYDARTNVDELYKWQSDGPFLYDYKGNEPTGQRDAGALEFTGSCDLLVSETTLMFDETTSVKSIIVNAADGFLIRDITGDFFSVSQDADTIEVTVSENVVPDSRAGSFKLIGCDGAQVITISQSAAPCVFRCETDTLEVSYSGQILYVIAATNGEMNVSSNESFVTASIINATDTVEIQVTENMLSEGRTAEVEIGYCEGIYTIVIVQHGVTGINGYAGSCGMEIFPNPVSENYIHIMVPGNTGIVSFTLTDLTGKALRNGLFYNHQGSIRNDLDPGIYILKAEEDGRTFTGRIVVL
ncbi:MAG: LamG-like jellyroll fold domain-containing protein [Bacteroidales bacterium]